MPMISINICILRFLNPPHQKCFSTTTNLPLQAAFASCKKDDLKPEALTVSFSVTPAEPVTESEAVFTVEVKGGEFPFTYEWNFGDNLTGSKYQETVIYKTSGEKKVSLKVTDNNGSVGFAEKTINVRAKTAVPQI